MEIIVYGADWCADCIVVKNFLSSKLVEFEYIMITDNLKAISYVEHINKGKRIIPTVVINGQAYSNPGINKLMKLLENKD